VWHFVVFCDSDLINNGTKNHFENNTKKIFFSFLENPSLRMKDYLNIFVKKHTALQKIGTVQ